MPQLPDSEKSLWRESYPNAPKSLYPELNKDLTVDVAVVGAGITGLTTAYLLKRAGLTVAVVEKHTVGGGTTGRTTGKVTSQHGLVYADLKQHSGEAAAKIYGQANQAAIEQIGRILATEHIECDWSRDDNYVYTADPSKISSLKEEAKVAATLGLPATYETTAPLPFQIQAAVKFTNQAKINAQKYLIGLAQAINGQGSYIFENSTVIGIRDGHPGRIKTLKGSVTAAHIVVASSVPTLPLMARGAYSVLEYPKESYIVSGRLTKPQPGMYISPDKRNYSILPIQVGHERRLLIGGESHFFGFRGNRPARFRRLAHYAEKHFGAAVITHRWSDRDYLSYDKIPLVGKLYPWSKNLYVGTAFMKWGLTNGTVAAMILSDIIQGKSNPWAHTFNSMRSGPIKAIPRWLVSEIKGLFSA